MNNSQSALLELTKQSLFEITADKNSTTGVNWDEVYDEAVSQSVIGLIIPFIPEDIVLSDDRWKNIRDIQLAYYIRYIHAEDQLEKLLDSADVPFVILKGCAAAVYYNHPERRMMGDIDFIVPQGLFDKACDLLSNNGYVKKDEGESHDQRHVEFKKNHIIFELHRYFSRKESDIDDYLVDGMNNVIIGNIESHEFPMLPPMQNGLVLLEHMRAHLQSGLGLRQVIDWMMYVNKEMSDVFWNKEFASVAKDTGLETLAIVTTRMCQLYLGLPESICWCKEADESLCAELLDSLFVSGNFGYKNGRGTSIEMIKTKMKTQGRFRWLQTAGEHNWQAYHKHHWLKPFCWIYQGFRYAKQGLKTRRSRKQIKGDLERANQRYELLKKLNID